MSSESLGLQLTGDLSSGIDPRKNPNLGNNISFLDSFALLLFHTIKSCRYKTPDKDDKNSTIFVCIPKGIINSRRGFLKPKNDRNRDTTTILNNNLKKLLIDSNFLYLKKSFLLPTFLTTIYSNGELQFDVDGVGLEELKRFLDGLDLSHIR